MVDTTLQAGTELVRRLKSRGEWDDNGCDPGPVAGVNVNDAFKSRQELRMIGMNIMPVAAMQTNEMDVGGGKPTQVVSCIVMSGNYEDDKAADPLLEQIIWTGE